MLKMVLVPAFIVGMLSLGVYLHFRWRNDFDYRYPRRKRRHIQ